jgi:ABC-type phosphate transport system substrate-binding protein
MAKYASIVLTLVLLLAQAPSAADFLVAVNSQDGPDKLSRAEIKRIYTGKQTSLGSLRIVPINLPLDSEIARKFLATVVGMTPEEYKKYWVEQQVRGEATAPMIQRTSDNVTAVVSELPGGIGYVDPQANVSKVKTIAITD